jgi:molecular chaperone DnaJ
MTDFLLGPGRRDALLIATGTYDDRTLSALRSPGQDCAGLAEVLGDPRIGGFHTEQVRDAQAHQVMRSVERFFVDRSRDDLLLLHVSCHGIKDDDGHLYFAARDTNPDLPASSAVPAAFLRERMERCRARTIIVLLDCCYSGAFLPGTKGDDQIHVRDELGGHGRAVLTATSRTEYAWEGKRVESKVPQPSRFTGALIKGLGTGEADLNRDGRITVTELYDYVYESLHRAGVKQRPRMWADLEYQVTIARVAEVREPTRSTGVPSAQQAAQVPPPPQAPPTQDDATATQDSPSPSRPHPSRPHPSRPRARRGQDATIRLELTLEETAFGTEKEITLDTAIVCPVCSGSGDAKGLTTPAECESCGGSGRRRRPWGQPGKGVCLKCDGSGTRLRTCPECADDGRVRTRRTLTVNIPAGVDTGTRIQFTGESEVGPGGGPPGDLYVEVVELPHAVFQRIEDDLHCIVTIPQSTAKAGGTIPLETLDGRKTFRIPPGIRNGQTLRLANLGATHLRAGGRGDLLVHIEIAD